MRIFCFEEDVFFAEGLKRVFARYGLEFMHSPKAEQAVARVVEEQPEVVLLDLRLSPVTGFEVLAALKEDARTSTIPVMIWSQVASSEDVERCFALGACEYFLKGQHEPRDVVAHLVRRYAKRKDESGFTLMEALVVVAAFLLALVGLWWQVQQALRLRRDDGQMQAVRAYVSTLTAAREDRAFLLGCTDEMKSSQPVYACRVCKDEACAMSLPVPWTPTPPYEGSPLDPESVCSRESVAPCHVSIESDGDRPRSIETFKLRFFLRRDRDGLAGGRTHTINAEGVVE